MRPKRSRAQASEEQDLEEDYESPAKQFFDNSKDEPGTSSSKTLKLDPDDPIEILEIHLHRNSLNVHDIGKVIAEGMADKTLNDESLKDLTRKLARNIHTMPNINIWNLADELNKGVVDSRFVIIGNAFLWNLLKSSMATVRDRFDHYHFKMSNINQNASVAHQIDFISSRIQPGDHIVMPDTAFRKLDLLDVYQNVVFRKTGDVNNKAKQFVKAYFVAATHPKCAIWHYSLRQSGTSHKKTLQDLPPEVLDAVIHFMICLTGLGDPELTLSFEEISHRSRFYGTLGDSHTTREAHFESLKTLRESMVSKFRVCVTDVLNEIREMPYNTVSCELLPPPRGKPIDTHQCVTWRQYEAVMKRCQTDPSKENLEAKQDLDYKLMLAYQPAMRDDDDIDVDVVK